MATRVGIDISAIPYNRGISRYTSNLVRSLAKKQDEVALRVFGASRRQQDILKAFVKEHTSSIPSKILPYPAKIMEIVWNRLHLLSPELFFGKLDVFHSWEMQPPLDHAALVSTIHDLAMLRFPKTADPYLLSTHERSWKHLKKEAKKIIAVSEATKKDVVDLLQIQPERVEVVYEAMPDEAKMQLTQTRKKELLEHFHLEKPYILFVGTLEPRKNLRRLVQAWQPLQKEFDLVLAGAAGWESISTLPGIRKLGQVSNEELAALYGGSSVLAYPSLYEGFGFPILDAFYHNVPVVTSDISSMPEVAGDAAVYVNPQEVESIRRGLEDAIHHSKQYVTKGKQRFKKFASWDKVADETIAVYKKAAACVSE